MKTEILISIITVTYNAKPDIVETFNSIIPFLSEQVEFIVIDGESTDGTNEEIEKIKHKLSYSISEKDKGIYDAMNKAIKIAKGKYLYFINAGDRLLNLPLNIFEKSSADLLCFPVKLSNGRIFKPSIGNKIKIKNTLPHQGCFYKNSVDLVYDLRYKVFADFSLNQQLYKAKKQINVLYEPIIAYHAIDGISNNKSSLSEIFVVVQSNFGNRYKYLSMLNFKWFGFRNRINKIFDYKRIKK